MCVCIYIYIYIYSFVWVLLSDGGDDDLKAEDRNGRDGDEVERHILSCCMCCCFLDCVFVYSIVCLCCCFLEHHILSPADHEMACRQ